MGGLFSLLISAFGTAGLAVAVAGAGGGNDDERPETQTVPELKPEPTEDETPEEEATPIEVANPEEAETAPVETPVEVSAPAPTPDPVVVAPTQPDGVVAQNDAIISTQDILSGRVAHLSLENSNDIASLRVTTGPEHGNVTVNPDNTFAAVMTGSDFVGTQSFEYEITHLDGSTTNGVYNLDVQQGPQGAGWGTGEAYMLRTDDNDEVIIETGENHRKVYVSGSNDALSRSDIAALEGLTADQINGNWLAKNPQYGGSEGMALDQEAGGMLWDSVSNTWDVPHSNWLMLERGYSYDDSPLGYLHVSQRGEDELHPAHITAWGTGDRPILNTRLHAYEQENLVISDIEIEGGVTLFNGKNFLFENVLSDKGGFGIQGTDGLTVRHSEFLDLVRDAPNDANPDYWAAHLNRVTGGYIASTENILFENNLWDHNGWADNYREDGSSAGGQPPSMFSHNLYVQYNTLNVTFRDNISMRAGSFGAQFRGGAFIEDNVFLDNNASVNFLGNDADGHSGNYTLFTNNVVTSGAHKNGPEMIGARSLGVNDGGLLSTIHNNIIAHLADPNNPDEIAAKTSQNAAFFYSHEHGFYNDTIIYRWGDGRITNDLEFYHNVNVDGLDPAVLAETTIQNYTKALLGDPNAGIPDLANHLRADLEGTSTGKSDAELIIDYFQSGFGLDVSAAQIGPQDVRFIPNILGEGTRWDNRLNWDNGLTPEDGDNIDLAGNWVQYGGTTEINNLDMGPGGKLNVSHGYLEVKGTLGTDPEGAQVDISRAGQFVTNGYSDTDQLTINVAGGRFANTGDFTGTTNLTASDGQSLLALDGASFDLSASSRIDITGSGAKVGFDGNLGDTAVLRLEEGATINFTADAGGFGHLSEFRSGMYDQTGSNVNSGINMGNATLEIDVTALAGAAASSHLLLSADEIFGNFDQIKLMGLGATQDARLTIDYGSDTVLLDLLEPGSGTQSLSLEIARDDGRDTHSADEIWNALTKDQPAYSEHDLPQLFVEDTEMPLDHIMII